MNINTIFKYFYKDFFVYIERINNIKANKSIKKTTMKKQRKRENKVKVNITKKIKNKIKEYAQNRCKNVSEDEKKDKNEYEKGLLQKSFQIRRPKNKKYENNYYKNLKDK